jgi:endonuclease/exonuclease/phosphatase family metal-dependent hydrolase
MVKDGKPFYGKQPFADYIFITPDIKVKNFEVPDLEISDHLPMILDFDI